MKTIVVATANQGKLDAVQSAFESFGAKYGWDEYRIISVDAKNGVSVTPTSDDEGLAGCKNRLETARISIPQADMYIALEGIVCTLQRRTYIRGWTMMEDSNNERTVSASGASVEVPEFIAKQIKDKQEFNHFVRDAYPMDEQTKSNLRNIGANGAFTRGEYGRQDSFYDGVRICLSLVANPHNW